ncbi:MAG: sulfotransferase domain-containing protein [Flavobacteriales bacterium]
MSSIWRKYHGALIPWKPPHLDIGLSRNEIKQEVKNNNAFFARWTTNFDSKKQSVFWYIINDKKCDLKDYSVNTRSKIKRGFKKLSVKKISKQELLKSGYLVYKNALERYDVVLQKLNQNEFRKEIDSLDQQWDFWGVYCSANQNLVAYSLNRVVDDYCDYSTIKFDPKYLRDYSSYILYYSMNKYYLNDNNFKYVNNGTRSISHQTNIHDFLIDKFKFRKAYCKMEIEYAPVFKILINSLSFFGYFFSLIPLNIFRKLHVVLYQECIQRICEKIYSSKKKESTLILSNGNFKSGSTWVTAIAHEIYNYRNIDFPHAFQNPKHTNWINRFRIEDFLNNEKSTIRNIWVSKSHIFQERIINEIMINQDNIKVINIDRDIKDVLVSHYHHLINAKKIKGDFKKYFYKWGMYKAKQILDYRIAWKDYDCLKLKYEDLLEKNHDTIQQIAKYLKTDLNKDQVIKIHRETNIDNLRANLDRKYLNEEKWFFRKGKKGDWQNYFDDEMISKINSIISNKISIQEQLIFYIKFTLRLKIKYFLYRFFPPLYVKFDKLF